MAKKSAENMRVIDKRDTQPASPTADQLASITQALNMVAKTKIQLRVALVNLDRVMNDVREACGAPFGHIYDTAADAWVRPSQQNAQRQPPLGGNME